MSRGAAEARAVAALAGVDRRSERSVAITVGVLLCVIGALFSAAPRALDRAEAESLEQAIAVAPAVQRRLAVRAIDNFPPGFNDDPLRIQRTVVDRAAEVLPEPVDAVYGAARMVADTNRFVVGTVNGEVPGSPTTLTFRVHQELDDNSDLVDGRSARRTDEMIDDKEVVEFEISTVTAEVMGLVVGDIVDLFADTSDSTTRRYVGGLPDPFLGRVVGLRELTAPDDPYWFGDARLHRPLVADTGIGANFSMYGSIPKNLLPVRPFLVDGNSPFTVEQRRDLLADEVTVEQLPDLLDGLEALDAATVAVASPGRPAVVSSLRRVLDAEAEQQAAARSTLALAATGVLGVALVALAQSLQVAFARRRGWLTVARVRGATSTQVISSGAMEVGVLALIAIPVGSGAARLALGGATSMLETRLLAALFLGSVAAAVLLGLVETQRPVGAVRRDGGGAQLGKWGRIVGSLVVAVALGAFVTFRRRGLATDADIDALVLLVPIVVPLAFVFLTRWVLPALLGLIGRAGMRLGPGRLVGLRRAMADPDASLGLVAVLALALTVAGLGLGVNRSLSGGIVDASWTEVRAPYRVDTRDPSVIEAIRSIDGLEIAEIGDNQFRLERDGDTFNARLINVESSQLVELRGSTAAELHVPDELAELDDEGAVRVIAAPRIGGQRVRVGDRIGATGSSAQVVFVVAEVRAEVFGRDRDWVLADRGVFESVADRPAPTSSMLFDGSSDAIESVRSLAAEEDLDVADRAAIEELQRADPLVRAVRVGYLAAGLVALLLALLAIVGLAVVTARQRRRDVSVLGLLGAERSEATRAVRWELLAPVIAGVVAGTMLGWFLTVSFDGRFELSSFASGVAVDIVADVTAQLIAGLVVAIAALLIITVLSNRIVRSRANDVLRVDGAP
jgi:hypothetical protein